MPRFDYVRALSVDQAVELMNDPRYASRPVAGGTDLLVLIRHQKPNFDRVVDLTRVPEMKLIEQRGDEVYIGASASFSEVAESEAIRQHAPCLVEAALTVGGPAIRNAGTIGGNTINAAACADGVPPLVCIDAPRSGPANCSRISPSPCRPLALSRHSPSSAGATRKPSPA
ncbi:MAG: FAD binding domain-containing protein [Anaerolineae bacterium]|nr:FAD binding domain-containing protein [Anaerolineae bacterium]